MNDNVGWVIVGLLVGESDMDNDLVDRLVDIVRERLDGEFNEQKVRDIAY